MADEGTIRQLHISFIFPPPFPVKQVVSMPILLATFIAAAILSLLPLVVMGIKISFDFPIA